MPAQYKKVDPQVMRDWVIKYLLKHTAADCLSAPFHERFFYEFRYARKDTNWGSAPVAKAMQILRQLASEGICEARHIGLGLNWQPGFPKYVRGYCLSDFATENYKWLADHKIEGTDPADTANMTDREWESFLRHKIAEEKQAQIQMEQKAQESE